MLRHVPGKLTVLEKLIEVVGITRQLKDEGRASEFLWYVLIQQFQVFVHVINVGDFVDLRAVEAWFIQLTRYARLLCICVTRELACTCL